MTTKQLYTDIQSTRIHFYENKDSHNCFDSGNAAGWRSSENFYAGDLHGRYSHHLYDQQDWSDFASDVADGYCSSAETSCAADLRVRYEEIDMEVLRGETAFWYWVTYGEALAMPLTK
ncbi:hypothetical protein C5167_027721 [Papaver somniferum]|nr:hypothetical protein C5167_027721 [Papaver somniferum]